MFELSSFCCCCWFSCFNACNTLWTPASSIIIGEVASIKLLLLIFLLLLLLLLISVLSVARASASELVASFAFRAVVAVAVGATDPYDWVICLRRSSPFAKMRARLAAALSAAVVVVVVVACLNKVCSQQYCMSCGRGCSGSRRTTRHPNITFN